MKKIFVIDWTLIPLFVFCAYTGIELHIAGHGDDHEVWHCRAVFHVAASLLFVVAAVAHVVTHGGWYKGLVVKGVGTKSKITCVLSLLFVFVVVTGVVLLAVAGANSGVGGWHYRTGLLTCVLAVGHIVRRIPALRKSLKITSGK